MSQIEGDISFFHFCDHEISEGKTITSKKFKECRAINYPIKENRERLLEGASESFIE
jgi:hypothetical protein